LAIDLEKLITTTQLKGIKAWLEYPDIPGFEVEIAYIDKQEMMKIYQRSTIKRWSSQERRQEEELDRVKLTRELADRVVLGWRGLTLENLRRLYPVQVEGDIKSDEEIEASPGNRFALLNHSTDFENWVVTVATTPSYFDNPREKAEKEMKNLGK